MKILVLETVLVRVCLTGCPRQDETSYLHMIQMEATLGTKPLLVASRYLDVHCRSMKLAAATVVMLHSETLRPCESTSPLPIPDLSRVRSPSQVATARLGLRTSGSDISRRNIFACSITGVPLAQEVQLKEKETNSTAKIYLHSIYAACMLLSRSSDLRRRETSRFRPSGSCMSGLCNSRAWSTAGIRPKSLHALIPTVEVSSKGQAHGMNGQNTLGDTWRRVKGASSQLTVI